jgi:serine/threonine protein kinase
MNPRVVGRYEIVRQLGHGGMATVHLARQPALDRQVALKELHPAHAADAAFATRFLNESRVAGALNHPSVVSVIEYFEHDGAPFIAMEYLERGSLRPLVGRLTLAHVAGVLEGVLAGLGEAHAQGIVHRDLKPENVLLCATGRAKIADFGIAKALDQVQMTALRTQTGLVVGTPAYMAPEQALSGPITPATDLYAVGLIAYELLAGHHPYHDVAAPMALMLRHANDEPPPLGLVREDLPPGVVAWVHAMLAKDPAARPASAGHAWDWLEGVVEDELGARWRRAAELPEEGARTGFVSTVVTALPSSFRETNGRAPAAAALVATSSLPATAAALAPPPSPSAAPPAPPSPPDAAPPAWPSDVPDPASFPAPSPRPRRSRRRPLLAGLAATMVIAAGAAGLSVAQGEEPPAPPKPAGPSLAERVRDVITPALRANQRVTAELRALAPGADPDDALDRADAALPVTRDALARADVPAARSALRAQASYLDVVRDTLRLDPGEVDKLGGASARLVARLERIDPLVPGAADSVGGAKKLKAWAIAELVPTPDATAPVAVAGETAAPIPAAVDAAAKPEPPAEAEAEAAPPEPTVTPSPTATPTPIATPTSTPAAAAPRARQFHPRRALRRILRNQRAVTPPGA